MKKVLEIITLMHIHTFSCAVKIENTGGEERRERTSEDGLGHYCNRHLVLIAVDKPVTEASDPNSGVLYLEKTVGMTRPGSVTAGRMTRRKKVAKRTLRI